MRHARPLVLFGILVAGSCGGNKQQPLPPPKPDPITRPDPHPDSQQDPDPIKPVAAVDSAPELFAPTWKRVGVGQTIHFSVAAIDQDLDETRVMVTNMPKSATFDAITQTVSFTPTKNDVPRATTFTIPVAEQTPHLCTTRACARSARAADPSGHGPRRPSRGCITPPALCHADVRHHRTAI